jgi:hypothetical protein
LRPGEIGLIEAFIAWVRFMQSDATAGGIARQASSSAGVEKPEFGGVLLESHVLGPVALVRRKAMEIRPPWRPSPD